MEKELRNKLMVDVPNIVDRSQRERDLRKSRSGKLLKFGVNFLDRALEGIAPNDLIIIGAPPGTGKTELVTHVAGYNSLSGKRVLFFPLEAEECEIESRIKFKLAAQLYYNDHRPDKTQIRDVTYRNWYHNKLGSSFDQYEFKAEERFRQYFKTFKTIYRKSEFKVDDLQRHLMLFKEETDLVIIDHLHYFDFDDPNENKAITEIVKKIRDLALISSKPIILVAHIKKPDKRYSALVPDLDEFHGTSNITKIATKAILLAPDPEAPQDPKRFETYFRAAKFRVDGSVKRYLGKCLFNIETNKYEEDFELGCLSPDGKKFEPLDTSRFPAWAKKGIKNA